MSWEGNLTFLFQAQSAMIWQNEQLRIFCTCSTLYNIQNQSLLYSGIYAQKKERKRCQQQHNDKKGLKRQRTLEIPMNRQCNVVPSSLACIFKYYYIFVLLFKKWLQLMFSHSKHINIPIKDIAYDVFHQLITHNFITNVFSLMNPKNKLKRTPN